MRPLVAVENWTPSPTTVTAAVAIVVDDGGAAGPAVAVAAGFPAPSREVGG